MNSKKNRSSTPFASTLIRCTDVGGRKQIEEGGTLISRGPARPPELVGEFADMTAEDAAKEHGWQLKEATAHQRHAPHTTAAGHRGMGGGIISYQVNALRLLRQSR
jgi:hypothetical protein